MTLLDRLKRDAGLVLVKGMSAVFVAPLLAGSPGTRSRSTRLFPSSSASRPSRWRSSPWPSCASAAGSSI